MAFLAAGSAFLNAIGAIAAITSTAVGVKSLISGGDQKEPARAPAPEPKPLPKTPTIEDATKKAEDQVARRRRISLLSGGRTNITRGQSLVPESAVARKSLLGE